MNAWLACINLQDPDRREQADVTGANPNAHFPREDTSLLQVSLSLSTEQNVTGARQKRERTHFSYNWVCENYFNVGEYI